MKNLALIVAGGSGSRFGTDIPKQYQLLGSKTILQHSVDAFLNHPQIDGVLVVISPEHQRFYKEFVTPAQAGVLSQDSRLRGNDRLLGFCFGGATRQDSVRLGLVEALKFNPKNALIHDAARPFITADVIDNVLAGLQNNASAIPVISAKDSVRIDGVSVDRNKLQIIQTPQGFDFKKILHAHQHHSSHWVSLTDDAQVFEAAGHDLNFVEGSAENMKITTKSDVTHNAQRTTQIGMGFDVHAFEEGDGVIICGVKIPHNKKLKGHSDADVGLHAITDAILGAIGAGDIGEHFSPSDERWKGADSAVFLRHAASLVKGVINNIDVTIICEEPKITPHKAAMKARIAEILGLDVGKISVKATTTEGLGFTGRRQGIAAQAVVSVS